MSKTKMKKFERVQVMASAMLAPFVASRTYMQTCVHSHDKFAYMHGWGPATDERRSCCTNNAAAFCSYMHSALIHIHSVLSLIKACSAVYTVGHVIYRVSTLSIR